MKRRIVIFGLGLILGGCSTSQGQAGPTNQIKYKQARLSDEALLKSMAIYEGVEVEDLNLAGANKLVAKEVLKDKFDSLLDKEVSLTFKDSQGTYSLRDLGYSLDYDKAVDEAYRLGREEGSDEERLEQINSLETQGKNIDLAYSFDPSKAKEVLNKIKDETIVYAQGGSLEYDYENDKLVVSGVEPGEELDVEKGIEIISKISTDEPGKIALEAKESLNSPELSKLAESIDGPIGTSESYFGTWFWERAENVRLSTSELNGIIIYPGETFSFNDYIGDTPYERGYQDSIIIEGTTEVPGKGGGVCQTSTALYHAVLKAGLEIVERHPHTLIMPYSPGGLDAAVEYGIIDLKFKNPYDFPVLIKTYNSDDGAGQGTIYFEIWGDTAKAADEIIIYSNWNYDVMYDSVKRPTATGYNTPGVIGSSWTAYRENSQTGEVQYLGDTYYPAVTEVINVEG